MTLKLRNAFICTFILLLLTIEGCATAEKLESKLKSWVGKDADALITSWGYPDSTIKAPNGNVVYIYKKSEQYQNPGTGYIFSIDCNITFELSDEQKIINWGYRGNGCTSR